jgi:hypothetical protein
MTVMAASPAQLVFARRGWIQSPAWDFFWIFSAIWASALLLAGSLAQPLITAPMLALLVVFERGISVTHAWSTTYMVLGSPLMAAERRANWRKYRLVPALIVALAMALGLYVGAFQRYPADGAFGWSLWPWGLYLALFWVGHFWHFGNQDFGVLTIYRSKAGQDRWIDRRIDKLYTAAMMFVIQPIVYVGLVTSTAFSEMLWTVLPLTVSFAHDAATAAVAAAALLTLAAAAFEVSKPNRSLPKLLYIGVIFLHPTLLYAAMLTLRHTLALLYVIAYLWSHWFVAVGLVGRINTRFYRVRGDTPGTALARHAAVIGVLVGLALLVTEHFKDYALFNVARFHYKELLAAITPEWALVIGLVIGFFLAEQLLHYYCDRCLFRFREPGVRRAVGPLLLGELRPPASPR